VPATFTVLTAGKVEPPSISIPAHFAIELTVVSGDGRPHQAVLRTTKPYPLSVPAHARASVLVPGQRAGQYALDVDGGRQATVLIGGQPGP
jgi:hypothetical protein